VAAALNDAGRGTDAWWRDALVYQIYVRSFQDSDGDGIGDLRGVIRRLDHVKSLGADAIWLSPIHPSPNADLGYDVADYMGIDPVLGTAADFDELVAAAHARGLRVLLDLVASHTSIEHPWFRDHPERYIWADDGPPNNWRAAFGGPAWSRDAESGRWYLHSFFAEQADLDWRNPDVRREIGDVVAHWLERGVDGFRVDAAQQLVKDERLRDDPPASAAFGLPLHEERVALRQLHSGNDPETTLALSSLRESAGDAFLVGEVYLPTDALRAYLQYLDSAFAFEFFHAPWDAARLREVIAAAAAAHGDLAWVLSSHDFPRAATRLGPENTAAAALLMLTLPGPAFVYQGEEIGMVDGPCADPPLDRAGRDGARHPMQWEAAPHGGFTDPDAEPWLPAIDPERRNVADQDADPGSMLDLYRRLISLRRRLGRGFALVDAAPGVVAYERGSHLIAVNTGGEHAELPRSGEVVIAAGADLDGRISELPPRAGVVLDPA
jgi:alpha-glucosidase